MASRGVQAPLSWAKRSLLRQSTRGRNYVCEDKLAVDELHQILRTNLYHKTGAALRLQKVQRGSMARTLANTVNGFTRYHGLTESAYTPALAVLAAAAALHTFDECWDAMLNHGVTPGSAAFEHRLHTCPSRPDGVRHAVQTWGDMRKAGIQATVACHRWLAITLIRHGREEQACQLLLREAESRGTRPDTRAALEAVRQADDLTSARLVAKRLQVDLSTAASGRALLHVCAQHADTASASEVFNAIPYPTIGCYFHYARAHRRAKDPQRTSEILTACCAAHKMDVTRPMILEVLWAASTAPQHRHDEAMDLALQWYTLAKARGLCDAVQIFLSMARIYSGGGDGKGVGQDTDTFRERRAARLDALCSDIREARMYPTETLLEALRVAYARMGRGFDPRVLPSPKDAVFSLRQPRGAAGVGEGRGGEEEEEGQRDGGEGPAVGGEEEEELQEGAVVVAGGSIPGPNVTGGGRRGTFLNPSNG